jgi:hypothetical protein
MGMVSEEHLSAPRDRIKASSGVIGERVKMHQERKQKRTLQVKRMFEPDRMAPVNLQVAYEQVVPSGQYRIITPEQTSEKAEMILPKEEEVLA